MADVVMYKKEVCPFCVRARGLLERRGVKNIREIDIAADPAALKEMLEKSGGRRTVPQIFIDGRHIGGNDDLHELDQKGQLKSLLNSEN